MKALFLAAVSAATLMATAASAQQISPDWYVGGNFGDSFDAKVNGGGRPTSDSGWTISGAVGRRFGNGFRAEGELVYLDNDGRHGSGDTKTTAGFVNGYYDFLQNPDWQPFIGAGIGIGQVRIDGNGPTAHGDDTNFAYQLKVGLAHPFSDKLTGEIAYRYLGVTDVKIGSGVSRFSGDYGASAITVGLRFALGG